MKKVVTEEMKPQEEWFKRARNITCIKELAAFAEELLVDTEHDYGTVCHAIGAVAVGAAWMGAHIQGITGFQAGFVMWDFIRQWMYSHNECGLRIVDYDNMLYPQYEKDFNNKTLPRSIFEKMQEVAEKRLKEREDAHPDVVKHWEDIVAGVVPFGYTIKED